MVILEGITDIVYYSPCSVYARAAMHQDGLWRVKESMKCLIKVSLCDVVSPTGDICYRDMVYVKSLLFIIAQQAVLM
jgi:putative component of membrane protein insertase Oxa1/YidC/SpoIIIJ protein YidD